MKKITYIVGLFVLIIAASLLLIGLMPSNDQPNRIEIGDIEIRNHDTEDKTIELTVESNGKTIHQSTQKISGKENNTIHSKIVSLNEANNQSKEYLINVYTDSDAERSFNLSSELDSGCYAVQIRIGSESDINFLTDEGGYGC